MFCLARERWTSQSALPRLRRTRRDVSATYPSWSVHPCRWQDPIAILGRVVSADVLHNGSPMDYQTRYIRYFLAVADTGSFSRAAEMLRLSQPALSLRVQIEEKRIGFPVFDRSRRGVVPTEQGSRLLDAFRELIACTERVEKLRGELCGAKARSIIVGVSLGSDYPERARLFGAFAASFPAFHIEQQAGNAPVIMQHVLDGSLDIGVVVTPPDDRFDSIALRWLANDILLPAESPLAAGERVAPERLRGLQLAGFPRDRHPLLYDATIGALSGFGMKPSISPDYSASGLLAFAAANRIPLLGSHVRFSDDQLREAEMVRRPLNLPPATALMLIRPRGFASLTGDQLWRFARERAEVRPE